MTCNLVSYYGCHGNIFKKITHLKLGQANIIGDPHAPRPLGPLVADVAHGVAD